MSSLDQRPGLEEDEGLRVGLDLLQEAISPVRRPAISELCRCSDVCLGEGAPAFPAYGLASAAGG